VNSRTSSPHPPLFSGGAQHRGFSPFLSIIFILLLSPVLRAVSLPQIQSLVAELGSDDPRIRENALGELMDLKRPDLPMLRAAALSQSPLLPGQIASLRQIVAQVFLSGEKYNIDPGDPGGFIGTRFLTTPEGVLVMDRILGFPAYHYLRNGDLILQLIAYPQIHFRYQNDFPSAIMLFAPGDAVRMAIHRNGRAMIVSVPLDFRPVAISNTQSDDAWIEQRTRRAEAYWTAEFSILDPAGAPAANQASISIEPQ